MDEEELVRLVARGDREAFDELYRRTAPWLAVRLRRRCADDELVAEVMQDIYLAVWRGGGGVRRRQRRWERRWERVGWMWTIAARRLVDALRRRAREANLPAAGMPAQVHPAAEDQALGATVGDEVGEALRRLAPELGQVLQAMVPAAIAQRSRCRSLRSEAWLWSSGCRSASPSGAGCRSP